MSVLTKVLGCKAICYTECDCSMPGLVGPCHVFTGAKIGGKRASNGYGNIVVGGRSWLVHRFVWTHTVGPIPPRMEVDHRCRNRSCCNVDHLRVVTHKVNTTENSFSVGALNKAKTHCPQGHAYTPENTRINSKGARRCRACKRLEGRRKVGAA